MSPRSKSQFAKLRENSLQALKQAALELFAQNGYGHTSISQVAKKAGVSKGLVYNYFESKQALLHAIIEEQIEIGKELLARFLETFETPLEQLTALTEAVVRMVQQDINHWRFMTSLAFQPDVMQELQPLIKEQKATSIQQMTEIFERLGAAEPERETYLYGAMLDGILLQYLHLGPDYDLEGMQQYILRRYTQNQYPKK